MKIAHLPSKTVSIPQQAHWFCQRHSFSKTSSLRNFARTEKVPLMGAPNNLIAAYTQCKFYARFVYAQSWK